MIAGAKSRLGVHYHAPFFVDGDGSVHIVSVIGLWLEALSCCWKEVVFIGFSTSERRPEQDHRISGANIRFVNAGRPGGILTRKKRIISLEKAVDAESGNMDAMIVRAPTPRQETVFKSYCGKNKALYLVGEPPRVSLAGSLRASGLKGVLQEVLNRRRQKQTTSLARKCVVIANSVELCRRYGERLGKEIFYSPSSSLSASDFHHVEDRCQGGEMRLLFVGRVCRDKGVPELLDAMEMMKASGMKVRLDIIGGSGDADNIDEFKAICGEKGLNGVVAWNGRVPFGPPLFEFYRRSDILILPSRHEGFPRVIQEAMAHGTLVIVTRVGGIADVCEHERELYFIEKDPGSIKRAVEKLAGDRNLRKTMIKNGYLFAKDHLAGENEKKMTMILEREWS